MFELSDFGKAAPDHKPIKVTETAETLPIFGYGAADEGMNLYDRSKFEDGEILSYFRSRRISRKWVQYWMILQVSLLVLQIYLFHEVSTHSVVYSTTVKAACNENIAGTCKSRLWQIRQMTTKTKDQLTWEAPMHFHFTASAWSTYELQLDVLADPPEIRVPFELILKRLKTKDSPERTFYEYRTTGVTPVLINEGNNTRWAAKDIFTGHFPVPSQWEGSINLARHLGSGHFANPRHNAMYNNLREQLKSVRIITSEMVAGEKNMFQKNAPMCDLDSTWSNVMLRSMSLGSNRLDWITCLLGWSILASALVTALVWVWFSGRRIGDGVAGLKFHYLVAAKSVFQDLPLQALVLWYIFSWYEGAGGERCQLCILDIRHCEQMTPFHFSNFLVVALTLVSAISNQFLFTTDPGQLKTDDDVGFVIFVRVMLGCVMILPFSTAMVAFNGSLVQLPGLLHSLFLLPCFAGWVAFFCLMCFPVATLVDDEDLMTY